MRVFFYVRIHFVTFNIILRRTEICEMEEERLEKISACTLGRLFGYEPRIAKGIIDTFGTARAVFSLGREALREIAGPYSKISEKIDGAEQETSERLLDSLKGRGFDFVPLTSPDYPALLKECDDAPAGLYVRSGTGLRDVFGGRKAVAVVGTRDISPYGKEWCARIVAALAQAKEKPVIVSGFAIGVDAVAHVSALQCGLPTVGILPTGIDDVYPRRHAGLASMLDRTPGCALLTDFPPGTGPVAVNFLRRNRIIAGLCDGTILIESKIRGGGMMTARLASGYGRTVLALPGRVDDLRSGGCNALLRDRIAEPLTGTDVLAGALGLGQWQRRREKDLEEELRAVFAGSCGPRQVDELVDVALLIRGNRGISVGEIAERTGMPVRQALSLTGMLETEGFITTDILQRCCVETSRLLVR